MTRHRDSAAAGNTGRRLTHDTKSSILLEQSELLQKVKMLARYCDI